MNGKGGGGVVERGDGGRKVKLEHFMMNEIHTKL